MKQGIAVSDAPYKPVDIKSVCAGDLWIFPCQVLADVLPYFNQGWDKLYPPYRLVLHKFWNPLADLDPTLQIFPP